MHSLREPRVPMQLRVEINGADWEGKPYRENTFTANISRTGTRLSRAAALRHVGERVELRRGKDKAPYSVIWIGTPGSQVEGQIGLRCLDPIKNIWGVPLPPPILVSSDEEWAELSAGLPGLAPINETDEPPPVYSEQSRGATQSTAPAAATLYADEATVPEESAPTPEATEVTATEEPVVTHDARESSSFEEAFARLQAAKPPATERPAATLAANETSAPDEPPAPDQPPPAFADDEAAPAELPAPSVQPDTVTYGPQFLPEPRPPAAKPFYQRPVIYLGLGAALLLLLVLSWTRTRTVPSNDSSPVSASSAEPAAPPPAPAAQTQPTQQAPPPPTQPEPQPQAAPVVPPPTPVEQKPPAAAAGNFAVQVGAYESAATAEALAKSLGSRYDCQGVVDAVETGGKTLHRVRLLAPSQADAKALAARVRRERAFDAIVVKLD